MVGAQRELSRRLPGIVDRAASAEDGLAGIIQFMGGSGDRRYLLLTQNPDEIRPTGGFIGMYGVLSARRGTLGLERFDPIESWTASRPQATVPGEKAGSPFRFASPPVPQTLGNVNNAPDWPAAARRAADLWQLGGEEPVDGVISFTPAFMARIVRVLGPVTVAEFGETITAQNLIERFDFYTELAERDREFSGRKRFVALLGEAVIERLAVAPSAKWEPLADAVGQGFAAREAMLWAASDELAHTLAQRHWDGSLPTVAGDFFHNAEFSYAAKNGRGLQRTFDHHVALRRDGSAVITTTMTVANTEEAGRFNSSSLSYVTLYGPKGAVLGGASDPSASSEPPVAGHPAAGWLLAAPPAGKVTLRVVWEAPEIARRSRDGAWHYSLWWMRVPDHTGDVLNLHVELPEGWRWSKGAPSTTMKLDRDLRETWSIRS